jgi:hypothetical protein
MRTIKEYAYDNMTEKELKMASVAIKEILFMLDNGTECKRWQISAIVKAVEELTSVARSMKAELEDNPDLDDDWDLDETALNVKAAIAKTNDEEEFELDEAIEGNDYSSKRTNEKKSTHAHPNGKHIHHILHKGEVVGTIEPYSASKEKRKPGSRIVQSRTPVTHYQIHFHAGKGPTKSADIPLYHKLYHKNIESALRSAASVHSSWINKNEEVELDEAFKIGDKVTYQKNKRERGNAVISSASVAKKNHFYIKTEKEGTIMVPAGELELTEDLDFKVSVDGLPDMYMQGTNAGEIKTTLRKIVKDPKMVTSIQRLTSTKLKQILRDKIAGKSETEENQE